MADKSLVDLIGRVRDELKFTLSQIAECFGTSRWTAQQISTKKRLYPPKNNVGWKNFELYKSKLAQLLDNPPNAAAKKKVSKTSKKLTKKSGFQPTRSKKSLKLGTIGKLMRRVINELGWSKGKIAKYLGISESYISDIYHGRRLNPPQRESSIKVAEDVKERLKTALKNHRNNGEKEIKRTGQPMLTILGRIKDLEIGNLPPGTIIMISATRVMVTRTSDGQDQLSVFGD